jgi:hypothetical protein
MATYRASAVQLDPGLEVVERLVRLAVGEAPGAVDRSRVEGRPGPGMDAGAGGFRVAATPPTRRDLREK